MQSAGSVGLIGHERAIARAWETKPQRRTRHSIAPWRRIGICASWFGWRDDAGCWRFCRLPSAWKRSVAPGFANLNLCAFRSRRRSGRC